MDRKKVNKTKTNNELDIAPSDFSQAILRFVIVGSLLIWSLWVAEDRSISALLDEGFIVLTISYFLISIPFLIWTKYLNRISADTSSLAYRSTRIGAVVADISAISAYTALAGSHGLILYPIYLQTIIGHGYRYGLPYLYLSNSLGLAGFTAAIFFNRAFADTSLVVAYYLGLLLVPLYSLLLLRKHAQVQEKLKFVNESRSRFIANMSHELRTPLHAILSLNEVLREELVKQEHRQDTGTEEKLRMVNESAQHLLSLVNRILDIASADQAKSNHVRLEPVNLREVLSRTSRICAGAAYSKGITVQTYISPEVPSVVDSSKEYLEEILVNIAGNAVKYTENGYVWIHVSKAIDENELLIRILDSGIGIKEDFLPTIFEPFTMGDDASERRHYGTGLGLTITKQYIDDLGGKVAINSKVGIGTVVDLKLPITGSAPTDLSSNGEPVSVLIVTNQNISGPERLLFEHHNVDVVCVTLEQAKQTNLNEGLDCILIGSEYISNRNEIELIAKTVAAPISIYGNIIQERPSLGDNKFLFNTTVRPGIKEDILALRSLLISDAYKEGVEEETEELFRILVADDNDINLTAARLALESVGHQVDLVNNGELALEALSNQQYDLALMDMHMPGMNGIEAIKLYSFETEDPIPIILLTADLTEEAYAAATEVNVTAILSKPILPRELRKAVSKYAQRKSEQTTEARLTNGNQLSNAKSKSPHEEIVSFAEIRELSECGATREELLEMIEIFESDSVMAIELAVRAASEDRHSVIRAEMHSLRGAAGALGATALEKRAHEIEVYPLAANEIPKSILEGLNPLVVETARLLRNEIAPELCRSTT